MNLTSVQRHAYFAARLPGRHLTADGRGSVVKCVFHDDRKPSLSINVEKGVWNCFSGCGSGGVLDFEKKFSGCDDETAWANIAELCGIEQARISGSRPEAVYEYRDEDSNLLFQKLRLPGRTFSQRAKHPSGKWNYKLDGIRKVLYNLARVVVANLVFICEGEKDCDNLTTAIGPVISSKYPRSSFATTTNFDGAGKWRGEYSSYLTGKRVFIFPDNDEMGRTHAQQVANSIAPYAREIRIVALPGLAGKGDVSDFLAANGSVAAEKLLELCLRAQLWRPAEGRLLIPAPQFLSTASTEVEWLVSNVIQRGSNGFLCSLPKVGKSWLAVDLALSLALGLPWLGFTVPRPVKTALITREDNPALTKWRMNRLLKGKNRTLAELEGNLYVNSREQSPDFRVDKDDLLGSMIAGLKAIKPEFVILDVFNVTHAADENDNTQMRAVVEQLSVLQREVSCSIGVVHHFNKQSEGSLTQRLRGASAIAGWAEWLIGIESIAGESKNRRMSFELKATSQPDPVTYAIQTDDLEQSSRIERVEWTPEPPTRRGRRAEEVLQ